MFKQPVSVLVIIHTLDFNILLLERTDAPNFWQSVTGSQEQGESLEHTAWRELKEETGFSPEHGELKNWQCSILYEIYPRWRNRYAEGVTHNTEHWFSFCVSHPFTPTLAPSEHLQFQWVPWKRAADRVFSPTNAEAILKLVQGSSQETGF